MKKCYILSGTSGSYDLISNWTCGVYLDEGIAKKRCSELNSKLKELNLHYEDSSGYNNESNLNKMRSFSGEDGFLPDPYGTSYKVEETLLKSKVLTEISTSSEEMFPLKFVEKQRRTIQHLNNKIKEMKEEDDETISTLIEENEKLSEELKLEKARHQESIENYQKIIKEMNLTHETKLNQKKDG